MPAIEKPILKTAVKASIQGKRDELVTQIKNAQKKTKKGYSNEQAAGDLADAFTAYEDALFDALIDNIDTYISTYMARVFNNHMQMTTAPGGPTLIPIIPAD